MSINGLAQLFTEGVSNTTTTNSVDVGTRRWEGKDEYVYCQVTGSDASPGYGVIMTANTGYSVTITSVTQVSPAFGVVKHATIAASDYGWVLVDGFASLEVHANSAIGTGDSLVLADNGVWATRAVSTGFVAADAHAVASTASGGSVLCRVNCNG